MPKRHRVRARARRPVETAPQRAERIDRERPPERVRTRYRGAPLPPGGAYAVGEPSPALERAAAVERAALVKDFRSLGLVVAVTLGLLVASGVALTAIVR